MVIQHNIPAINSHRNLGVNNNATAKNLEKLSSGYRINRAGDDAAGLAISEKMRGQIRGLSMAEQNTSNAINMIQTAEGGLNETHAILQRMRELAVQASNGTYDDVVDRANIDKEIDALKSELDRIASSTNYNGINLLDGSMANKLYVGEISDWAPDETVGGKITISATNEDGSSLPGSASFSGTIRVNIDADGDISVSAIDSSGAAVTINEASGVYTLVFAAPGSDVREIEIDLSSVGTPAKGDVAQYELKFEVDVNGSFEAAKTEARHALFEQGKEVVFQIGANGTADQQVSLGIDNMASYAIGDLTTKSYVSAISLATRDDANAAIKVLTDATNQVSMQRAELGAMQNRLEHTLNNLGVTKENLTAAESTIRDVDMAKEMMEFTKNSILVQASQAMLAQANQLPQGILQLLR